MKKLIAVLVLASLLTGCLTGCGTTANNRATQTEAALIPSVNVAMSIWSAQVNAGRATQSQVDTVKIAYQNYYNAQIAFKGVLEKSIVNAQSASTETEVNIANQAVEQAKLSLLTILSQFTTK